MTELGLGLEHAQRDRDQHGVGDQALAARLGVHARAPISVLDQRHLSTSSCVNSYSLIVRPSHARPETPTNH